MFYFFTHEDAMIKILQEKLFCHSKTIVKKQILASSAMMMYFALVVVFSSFFLISFLFCIFLKRYIFYVP